MRFGMWNFYDCSETSGKYLTQTLIKVDTGRNKILANSQTLTYFTILKNESTMGERGIWKHGNDKPTVSIFSASYLQFANINHLRSQLSHEIMESDENTQKVS